MLRDDKSVLDLELLRPTEVTLGSNPDTSGRVKVLVHLNRNPTIRETQIIVASLNHHGFTEVSVYNSDVDPYIRIHRVTVGKIRRRRRVIRRVVEGANQTARVEARRATHTDKLRERLDQEARRIKFY